MILIKTIAFVTRIHPKRPNMLKVCIDSIKKQASDDYIHILHRDDKTKEGYGIPSADRSLMKVSPINARYVMVLDDDNMLIDPNFVKIFKKIINESNPEIVFFKVIIAGRVYPPQAFWKKSPVRCQIDSHCFAVRLDVWKKHIHRFNERNRGDGDFFFISFCYRDTTSHFWLDRIVVSTQKGRSRGMGEHEHD